MTPEFREHEMEIGQSMAIVCMRCASDYRVAARGECGCREANKRAGLVAEFADRIGEVRSLYAEG